MGRQRWDVLGATVVALVLVTAGCGGGGADGAEPAEPAPTTVAPSTTTGPSPDTTVLTDEQAVLAAYHGYWDTWLAANDPPDPNHPDLAKYATGTALAAIRETIAQHRSVGQALRLPARSISEHRASVERTDGHLAVVVDCSVDDGLVVDEPSGRVLNDAIGTWLLRTTLTKQGTQWLVTEVAVEGQWEGVGGCAA